MPKVTLIGAGSAVFAAEIIKDILATPTLDGGTFALVDIDEGRLEVAQQMAEWLVRQSGRAWSVEASTDRSKVLAGTDYVVNSIEVAGLANVRHDYDIPLKYGVDQCIGDTTGPGGLFKALRTLPAWLDILKDIEQLAPKALVMNYTNPMSLTVLTGVRASQLSIVGLCHSVQHTTQQLAAYLDIPYAEIDWRGGGINHLAWITKLERAGEDLYPLLRVEPQLDVVAAPEVGAAVLLNVHVVFDFKANVETVSVPGVTDRAAQVVGTCPRRGVPKAELLA